MDRLKLRYHQVHHSCWQLLFVEHDAWSYQNESLADQERSETVNTGRPINRFVLTFHKTPHRQHQWQPPTIQFHNNYNRIGDMTNLFQHVSFTLSPLPFRFRRWYKAGLLGRTKQNVMDLLGKTRGQQSHQFVFGWVALDLGWLLLLSLSLHPSQ